jgi:hypothetical protein
VAGLSVGAAMLLGSGPGGSTLANGLITQIICQ